MRLEAFVEQNLGCDRLSRLQNRSTGGRNNSKGNRYEGFFAVYQLASLYSEYPSDNVEVISQDLAFVDDFVAFNFDQNSKYSYQLKDVQQLTWENVREDFEDQVRLDRDYYQVQSTEVTLVLGKRSVYDLRRNDIPESLSDTAGCIHFQSSTSILHSITSNSLFRQALERICFYPDELDKLEMVAQNILGVWSSDNSSQVKVCSIIEKAQESSRPNLLRLHSGQSDLQLDSQLCSIFDNFGGFSYNIVGGYLNYEYNGLSGILQVHIESDEFSSFSSSVIRHQPSTIEELLVMFIQLETTNEQH